MVVKASIILKGALIQQFNEKEFFQFCRSNEDLSIERNKNREIIINLPTDSRSGLINGEICRQLANWNVEVGGGYTFDSSTGFTLPDHSVLSPDASWVAKETWDSLSEAEKKGFAPICPAFVVELKSKNDTLEELEKKMQLWLANGVELGWLIDYERQLITIYRKDKKPIQHQGFAAPLSGENILPGFKLDLSNLNI